jgi:hypothetical protein
MMVYPYLVIKLLAEEQSDTLFYPKPAVATQRRSIFMNNIEGDIQQFQIEHDTVNDPDIHFIQGDFFNYYEEKEIIGEGTTGTVKKCVKKSEPENVYAVKIVHYRDDAEMLTNVIFMKVRKTLRLCMSLKTTGSWTTGT